jgi:type II secretory pathway component PulF
MTAPQFGYRAVRRDGSVEHGVLQSGTRDAAMQALAERGLFPLEVALREPRLLQRRRMPTGELALGLRLLGDLLESGLPITRALATLAELAPNGWREALPSVREAVRQGKSLATALAAAPIDIPPLILGVIQAGEAGSGLASAVRRAAAITEEAAATQSAIRGALAYPLVLAAAGSTSVALLVGVVLPRFAAILADLGQGLPASTRLVLQTAEIAQLAFLPAVGALAIGCVVWSRWTATDVGRRQWHELLLAVPGVGGVRYAAGTARGCAALAALLDSGVPVASALQYAAPATGDAALAARMLTARDAIVNGQGVAAAFAAHRAATTVVLRLARAGEESGRLSSMIAHAGRLEHERATRMVKNAVRLLEPLLVVTLGGIIALVAAAMLQAIYGVRPGP